MGLAQRDIRDFQWENGTEDWSPSCESKGGADMVGDASTCVV